MDWLRREKREPSWADVELEALKLELRDRAVSVAEREADLQQWEQELERREERLERQRDALRRRRLQVAKRLMRLRGRVATPVASRNGGEPLLDVDLERRAAEVKAEAEAGEPDPKQRA